MSTPAADSYLGRESTIERLLELVDEAAAGRGLWGMLRGPSGGGTTETLRELAQRAAARGVVVLWGACREGLGRRPFEPLGEALDEHAGRTGAAALYAELGDAAPALARVAPAIRAALPATPPPAPLDPPEEMLRLHDEVLGWLTRASAERPVLWVIDDVQWADADVHALLTHLADHVARWPVFLLAGWAEEDAEAGTAPLPAAARVIELPGLDEGATGAWLARHADRPISVAALRLVQQVSGGHPLTSLELYRHLREEGFIGRPGGDALPTAESLPQAFDEIVAWRVARLSLEQRTALATLACFPWPASAASIAAVSGLSRARAADALEGAVEAGFARSPAAGGPYALAHPGYARVLIGNLSAPLHAEALARVAQDREAELGAHVRRHAAELASLYARALDRLPPAGAGLGVDRARSGIRHCLVAAEQSRAAAAYRRAADCLTLAHRLAAHADQPTRHELQLRTLVADAEADRPARVLAVAEELGARRLDPAVAAALVEALVAAARALRDHGRADAVERLGAVLERHGRAQGEIVGARLDLLAGSYQAVGAAPVQALIWQAREDTAASVLLEHGDEQDRAELFAMQRPRRQEQTVELLNQARNWSRPASLLRALRGATVDLATRLGLFREAHSWATEYAAAAERYGSPADRVRALCLLAQCQSALGELVAAEEGLAVADEALGRLPPSRELAAERLLADFVLAHYREADWGGLLARASELTVEPHPAGLLLAAETGVALARSEDRARSAEISERVIELVAEWPPLTYLRDSALLVALTTAWESGRAEQAARDRSLVQLAVAAGAGGNHTATPQLAIARTYALTGQLAEARALFAATREEAAATGLAPLLAIVDHDEAIALAAAGPRGFAAAAALLEQAAGAFEQLGMAGWQARALGLLDGGFDGAAQPGGRLHFSYPRGLSRREVDLVRLINGGTSLADAAAELELEPAIADRYLASALAKLEATDVTELHDRARRYGLGGAS